MPNLFQAAFFRGCWVKYASSGVRSAERGVRASTIIEIEISPDAGFGLADAGVGMQINVFVFDRAPQPFDEHVVTPAATAVHADRHP